MDRFYIDAAGNRVISREKHGEMVGLAVARAASSDQSQKNTKHWHVQAGSYEGSHSWVTATPQQARHTPLPQGPPTQKEWEKDSEDYSRSVKSWRESTPGCKKPKPAEKRGEGSLGQLLEQKNYTLPPPGMLIDTSKFYVGPFLDFWKGADLENMPVPRFAK